MAISAEEVNYLVYRYLQESGFTHSAFTFAYESLITKSGVANADVPPGALITFLQKGLQYVGIEEHLNEDGTERQCESEFSLLTAHVCQASSTSEKSSRGGGSKRGKKGSSSNNNSSSNNDNSSSNGNSDSKATAAAAAAAAAAAEKAGGEEGSASGANASAMDVDGGSNGDAGGQSGKDKVAADGQTSSAPRDEKEISLAQVAVLANHSSEVFMCAWNPRCDLLASGSGDSTARIWEIPPDMRGSQVESFASQNSVVLRHSSEIGDKNKDVTTLEWNREGSLLATGSYDGVARIWGKEGKLQHELEAHEGPIFSLKWNAQGNYLLSGSSDKTAIVWDSQTGDVKQRFEFHEAPTLDVDWKDDITFATCSTDKYIHILAVGEKYPLQTFTGHTDEVNAIKWDPSGMMLASCSDDSTAKIWQPSTSKCVHDLKEHKKEIYTIKWSPNPDKKLMLASASFDATVKLWDVDVGSVVSTLSRHEDPVYSVAFSPSGDYLASGSFAGHLYIWSVKDGTLVKSYQGDGDIFEVAWNHREDRIAACFSTSAVVVIDLRM